MPTTVQQVSKQRRAGHSSGSQKKTQAVQLAKNASGGPTATSVLTNDQLMFMMQQKRERLNQSQLVGSTYARQLEDPQQSNSLMQTQPTAGQIVNLNKLYNTHRKTPTNLHHGGDAASAKYQTTQPAHSSLGGTTKPTKSSVKPALGSASQTPATQHQEHKRAHSQLAQHASGQTAEDALQKQQGLPYNRKASMEG